MLIQYLLVTILVCQVCLAVSFGLKPRITDGPDATEGEFPYQVSIQWSPLPIGPFRYVCSGSIIHESFILTTGDCANKFGKLKILAGKHNLLEDESTQQKVDVAKAYVHEKYYDINKGKNIAPHNIAVLRLKTPLVFNKRVSAVNLPEENEVRVGNVVLSGWGFITKEMPSVSLTVLQKVTLPLLDNKVCQNIFSKEFKALKIYDTEICTAAVEEISSCYGDGGSPLVQFDNNTPTQIGIVSWGIGCLDHMPLVYTRLASYNTWIKSKIGLNQKSLININQY